MISYRELIENPEKFQPLSSHKSVKNLANEPDYTNVDIKAVFFSNHNRTALAQNLYVISQNNGSHVSYKKFYDAMGGLQARFSKIKNIDEYTMAESQAMSINDWAEVLRCVNNDFIKQCYTILKWNHLVPTRASSMVGPMGNRQRKKYSDMTAEDIPTIDVYEDYQIETMNNKHWLENKIPAWRASIQVRHYDRDNEGLRENNPDRASLDNPMYGYNMDTIHNNIDNWKKKSHH
jgi:hypothetical protein